MNELVYSGLGSEATDQSIESSGVLRPLWLLRPLPLLQVNRWAYGGCEGSGLFGRGKPDSLFSSCLGVISRNFHAYAPDTLTDIDPHLVRKIMSRVLGDRKYQAGSATGKDQPDEATLWMYIALADPGGAVQFNPVHTIALPPDATLAHLKPSRDRVGIDKHHPLVLAPQLFNRLHQDKYTFLTSLKLDGVNDKISDSSIQSLRYATHLTALWMRGCRFITDDGIRMLAMSLELPDGIHDGKGIWRLRAWWLKGSGLVTDKSMKSFIKWPGLALLDLRDTSCTQAAVMVFNKLNHNLYAGMQPPFQTCTDGLRGLFTLYEDPDVVMDKLAETLLKPDIAVDEADAEARRHLSLNVVSSYCPPPDHCLHEPPSRQARATPRYSETTRYVGGGIGQIYGAGAGNIRDDTKERRDRLAMALELQAEEDNIASCRARGLPVPERRFDREARKRREFWAAEKESRKKWKETHARAQAWAADPDSHLTYDQVWGDMDPDKYKRGHRWTSERDIPAGKVFRDEDIEAEARSRAFVKGRRVGDAAEEDVKGDSDVMLVRMVCPNWESLQYMTHVRMSNEVKVRKPAGAEGIVADMLLSQFPSSQQTSQELDVKPSRAELLLDRDVESEEDIKEDIKPSSRHFNPFRASAIAASSSGVRKLDGKVLEKHEVKVEIKEEKRGNPFSQRSSTSGVKPLVTSRGPLPKSEPSQTLKPLPKATSKVKQAPAKAPSKPVPATKVKPTPTKAEPKVTKETQTKLSFFQPMKRSSDGSKPEAKRRA